MNEPDIIINGRQLTVGQAMTVRVAISAFSMQLGAIGDDVHGRRMAAAYMERLREISLLMHPD